MHDLIHPIIEALGAGGMFLIGLHLLTHEVPVLLFGAFGLYKLFGRHKSCGPCKHD